MSHSTTSCRNSNALVEHAVDSFVASVLSNTVFRISPCDLPLHRAKKSCNVSLFTDDLFRDLSNVLVEPVVTADDIGEDSNEEDIVDTYSVSIEDIRNVLIDHLSEEDKRLLETSPECKDENHLKLGDKKDIYSTIKEAYPPSDQKYLVHHRSRDNAKNKSNEAEKHPSKKKSRFKRMRTFLTCFGKKQ